MLIIRPRPGRALTAYIVRKIDAPWMKFSSPSSDGEWYFGFFTQSEAQEFIEQNGCEEFVEVAPVVLGTPGAPTRFVLSDCKTRVRVRALVGRSAP